jgi:HEAT repeats
LARLRREGGLTEIEQARAKGDCDRDWGGFLRCRWTRNGGKPERLKAGSGGMSRGENGQGRSTTVVLSLLLCLFSMRSAGAAPPDGDSWYTKLHSQDLRERLRGSFDWASLAGGSQAAFTALKSALGDKDPNVRRSAVAALGDLRPGPANSVALLLAAVDDPDPVVVAHAVVALGKLGRAAVPALLAQLTDEKTAPGWTGFTLTTTSFAHAARADYAAAALVLAGRDSVGPLIAELMAPGSTPSKALQDANGAKGAVETPAGPDTAVDARSARISAILAQLGSTSIPEVRQLLTSPDERLRRLALETLLGMGSSGAEALSTTGSFLDQLTRDVTSDAGVGLDKVRLLADIASSWPPARSRALPALVQLLRKPKTRQADEASDLLRLLGAPGINAVHAAWRSGELPPQAVAEFLAFARTRDSSDRAALAEFAAEAVQSADPIVRLGASEALESRSTAAKIDSPRLSRMLADRDLDIALAAAAALAERPGSEDAVARSLAGRVLKGRGDSVTFAQLEDALEIAASLQRRGSKLCRLDEEHLLQAEVATTAVLAVGANCLPSATRDTLLLRSLADEGTARAAAQVLEAQPPSSPAVQAELQAILTRNDSARVRAAAAAVLAAIAEKTGTVGEALQAAVRSQDSAVLCAVAPRATLGTFGRERLLPLLRHVLRNDCDDSASVALVSQVKAHPEVLADLWPDLTWDGRSEATLRLIAVLSGLSRDLTPDRVRDLALSKVKDLADLATSSLNLESRLDAISMLAALGGWSESVLPALGGIVTGSSEPEARLAGATALWSLRQPLGEAAATRALPVLWDRKPTIRFWGLLEAASALGTVDSDGHEYEAIAMDAMVARLVDHTVSTIAIHVSGGLTKVAGVTASLPELPALPPYSSWDLLDVRLYHGQRVKLGDIHDWIVAALSDHGFESGLYHVPDGFAIVSSQERVDSSTGRSLPAPERFLPGNLPLHGFMDYLRRLFLAPAGVFRMFVFVVTPLGDIRHLVKGTEMPIDLAHWGGRVLPDSIRETPAVSYFVHVLVYQSERKLGEATRVVPSTWQLAAAHLHLAGLELTALH